MAFRRALLLAAGLLAGVGASWIYIRSERKEAEERERSLKEQLAESRQSVARLEFEAEGRRRIQGNYDLMAEPAQQTTVVAVDAAGAVVSIALGSDDGVKVGFRYRVARRSRYVATIEITEIRPGSSTGISIRDLQKGPIRVDDDVLSD